MLTDGLSCVQMVMDPLSAVLDDGPDPLSDLLAASDPLSAQTFTGAKKVSSWSGCKVKMMCELLDSIEVKFSVKIMILDTYLILYDTLYFFFYRIPVR